MNIKDLFEKYEKILFSEESKKEIVKQAVYELTNILIDIKNIQIKNGIINLNIKPIYKNEILIKKERILEKLKESLGRKAPKNIY